MVTTPELEGPQTLRYLYVLFSFKSILKLWGQGYRIKLTTNHLMIPGEKKMPMFTEYLSEADCWARFFAYILLHLLTTTTLWGMLFLSQIHSWRNKNAKSLIFPRYTSHNKGGT